VLPASLEPREKAEVSKVISFDSLKPNWPRFSHQLSQVGSRSLISSQKLQDNTRSIKILADYTWFVPDIVVKMSLYVQWFFGFPQFSQWEKVFHELSS
jgi:hypothetical protein